MKKKLFLVIVLCLAFVVGIFIISNLTYAYTTADTTRFLEKTKSGTGLAVSDIFQVMGKIISGLIALVGAFFVTLIIYAGFTWLTSTGDSGKIEKSKKTMTYAVIGVIVVIAAYNITSFVLTTIKSAPTGPLATPASTGGGGGGGATTCEGLNGTKTGSTYACVPTAACCTKPAFAGIGTPDFGTGSSCGSVTSSGFPCAESAKETCAPRSDMTCANGSDGQGNTVAQICCEKISDPCAGCGITRCGDCNCRVSVGANGIPACVPN